MTDNSPDPLVLLHAFPVDSRMFNGMRDRLSRRVRVITPDQRGLGRSPLPETEREPSLDDAARDVLAMLDRLGIDRAVFGGCSMGGYLAMAVSRLAPERIAGLVLIDTKPTADTDEAARNRLAVADRAQREGISGWLADSMLPNLLGGETREHRPDVAENTRELIDAQPPSGIAWAQRAMAARPDSTAALAAIDVPVLVIVGEQDSLTTPEQAKGMADALGKSEFVRLAGTGHLAPLENPDGVAGAIEGWLEHNGR